MNILDFINKYCEKYNLKEDDFSVDDVIYIEDCFYNYAETGNLPDFMRVQLRLVT